MVRIFVGSFKLEVFLKLAKIEALYHYVIVRRLHQKIISFSFSPFNLVSNIR